MKMCFCYTTDMSEATCWAIRRATGGPFSHTLVLFTDQNGEEYYYESIWSVDPATGKDGVRGPIPYKKLTDWHEEDPKFHILYRQNMLPVSDHAAMLARQTLSDATKKIRYARLQLFQNWVTSRTGYVIFRKEASKDQWTCSEACARVLPPSFSMEYLNIGNITFDYVLPSGNRDGTIGLFERMEALIRHWPMFGRPMDVPVVMLKG